MITKPKARRNIAADLFLMVSLPNFNPQWSPDVVAKFGYPWLPDKDQPGRPRSRQKESGAPITASPQAGLYASYSAVRSCLRLLATLGCGPSKRIVSSDRCK